MRKLASIQEIKKIEPIEGADRIELATVLGWHVVVQKGLYKEGDRVVYLEIDSVLPKKLAEQAGFKDKYLKTRKFRGAYSQGMCLPLTVLNDTKFPYSKEDIVEKAKTARWDDIDVTEYLGITKYEPDVRNDKQWWKKQSVKTPKTWYMRFKLGRWFWRKFIYKPVSGPFPSDLIPKTDETRCQVLQNVLYAYKGTRCQYTEKLDGSSITFWIESNGQLHVCSRNREIYDKTDFMFETASKLKGKIMPGVIYQGEIIGPNIQGNKYGLTDFEIRIYQAYLRSTKTYFSPQVLMQHCKDFGLKQVPVLGELTLTDNIDELVNLSIGMSALDTRTKETQREGIVVRPLENIYLNDSRFVGNRLSFKVINPKFLIKYNL